MAVKTYDPAFVSMFYGEIEIKGFSQDSAITVTPVEKWSLQVGVDGEGTRSKTSDRSATITVSLMQSSATNPLLSAASALDDNTPGGTGGKPLLIKDNSGDSVFSAETAWIEKDPDAEYNREATAREWTFRTDRMIPYYGSN